MIKQPIPFSTEEFAAIMDEMKAIHEKKNNDYSGEDYLSNFTASKRMGITPWKATLFRIQDKVSRLENFCLFDNLKVKEETIEDTLLDLATYTILCLILKKKKK